MSWYCIHLSIHMLNKHLLNNYFGAFSFCKCASVDRIHREYWESNCFYIQLSVKWDMWEDVAWWGRLSDYSWPLNNVGKGGVPLPPHGVKNLHINIDTPKLPHIRLKSEPWDSESEKTSFISYTISFSFLSFPEIQIYISLNMSQN